MHCRWKCRGKLGNERACFTHDQTRSHLTTKHKISDLFDSSHLDLHTRLEVLYFAQPRLHVIVPAKPQLTCQRASHIPHSAAPPHPCIINAHASRAPPERRDQPCLQSALLCGPWQPHLVGDCLECLWHRVYTTVRNLRHCSRLWAPTGHGLTRADSDTTGRDRNRQHVSRP